MVERIGILAGDKARGEHLAKELKLEDRVRWGDVQIWSVNSHGGRGCRLSTLLVDESAWPLTREQVAEFLPCLDGGGQLYRLERVTDPWPKDEDG